MTIPFYSGARSVTRDWPKLEPRIRSIGRSGRFTSGQTVRELELALAEYTGANHVVMLGSGTDALVLMLRAAGIGPGDEVIVPAYSFFATASCVLHVGADPVLVDILAGSYAIDPEQVAAAITPRTKAIMPVHLFTQMADMVPLRDLAQQHGLLLLEDSAEGIGMRMDGRHAGLWGEAGVLSFFPTKTLGTLGDAGAVLTNDDEIAARVKRLRCHGQPVEGSYEHVELGYNSRCDEIQAAVLLTRLEHLDADISRRAELAQRYTDSLSNLVQTPYLASAKIQSNLVYYVYLIETERRDALAAHLEAAGVGTEIYYPRTLSAQPALSSLDGAQRPVPIATNASQRAIGLPLYPDLTDEQVDRVCQLIHDFHGGTE